MKNKKPVAEIEVNGKKILITHTDDENGVEILSGDLSIEDTRALCKKLFELSKIDEIK